MRRNLAGLWKTPQTRFEWSRTICEHKVDAKCIKTSEVRNLLFLPSLSYSFAETIPKNRETFLILTLELISGSESPRCDVIWRVSCVSSSNVTQQGVEGFRYQSCPVSPVRYLSPHCLAWRTSRVHGIETNRSLPRSYNSFSIKQSVRQFNKESTWKHTCFGKAFSESNSWGIGETSLKGGWGLQLLRSKLSTSSNHRLKQTTAWLDNVLRV